MVTQTSYFQVVANVTTGTLQVALDTARSSLASQVNAFLASQPARLILDVQSHETFMNAGNAKYIILAADVTYQQ